MFTDTELAENEQALTLDQQGNQLTPSPQKSTCMTHLQSGANWVRFIGICEAERLKHRTERALPTCWI